MHINTSADVLAESVSDNSNFVVEIIPNLSITLPESTTLQIKSSQDGTFGSTNLTATVDTSDGYTLSMYATKPIESGTSAEKTTSLINTTNLSSTIDTITSDITLDQFSNKNNKEYNNKWGYSLNNTNYHPITEETMLIGSSTDGGSFANTITIGAKIDDTLPYGSYATVLNFIATAYVKIATHTITIKPTTGITSVQLDEEEACTDTSVGCNYTLDEGSTHTLTATVSDGYEFTTWTNSTEYGTFSDATTPTTTFTVGEGDAMVVASAEETIKLVGCTSNEPCMQNTSAITCDATARTVTDGRDGSKYKIGKLKDGKCWMLQDLKLGSNGDISVELNSTNTNVASGYTVSADKFNGWKVTKGTSNYTNGEWATNGSYGVLYNYCAASAGTYCYASGSGPADNNNGEIAGTGDTAAQRAIAGDICPAGWRLPTGGKDGEFMALAKEYGYNKTDDSFMDDSTLFNKMTGNIGGSGANFSLSGVFSNGNAPTDQGSHGYFWSSSRYGSTYMYGLTLIKSNDRVNPAGGSYRYSGLSVRCVLGS